jgi:hypothetical protein
MRRQAVRICVFLLLGAIVNVAVAWGFELTRTWHWPYRQVLIDVFVDEGRLMQFESRERVGDTSVYWSVIMDGMEDVDSSFVTEMRESQMAMHRIQYRDYGPVVIGHPYDWLPPPLNATSPDKSYVRARAYGWPALSMMYLDSPPSAGQSGQSSRVQGGWRVRNGNVVAQRILPLRPLWPGFAINTLFYAGILWLLFGAPFALRRRSRIRRGLCPACAYPIGASAVCTECGATVQSSARTA